MKQSALFPVSTILSNSVVLNGANSGVNLSSATLPDAMPATTTGLHVAIIMDGNGRWALARGRSRPLGHRAGVLTVKRIVEAAPRLGIRTLTLYAFSADNWRRPRLEVTALFRLLRAYLRAETARCSANGVRITMIGRRDRLAPTINDEITRAENLTREGQQLHLRLAIDYSARDAILQAALRLHQQLKQHPECNNWNDSKELISLNNLTNLNNVTNLNNSPTSLAETFTQLLSPSGTEPVAPVDLLIRTGGEQRLSDFLLWESAYAELFFTPQLWPDFTVANLVTALEDFARRDRRFGGVTPAVSVAG
jgi:undecaprenyl diphosphate synthase